MTEQAAPDGEHLLETLRARARELDAGALRARVRAAAHDFAGTLTGLAEADARRTLGAGEWTIAQVADHVAQSTVRGAEELRHLVDGRRPPGPPVYEALGSGAAHRVPWLELVEGVHEAAAALDAVLEAAARRPPPDDPPATARAILVLPPAPADPPGAETTLAAELDWKEYAFVLRLHFLDHRRQVRRLRTTLAAAAPRP
jgi:hypothetical protein